MLYCKISELAHYSKLDYYFQSINRIDFPIVLFQQYMWRDSTESNHNKNRVDNALVYYEQTVTNQH